MDKLLFWWELWLFFFLSYSSIMSETTEHKVALFGQITTALRRLRFYFDSYIFEHCSLISLIYTPHKKKLISTKEN